MTSWVTLQVLQAKTKNAVDILETSFILKKTRFVSREEGPQAVKGGRAAEDVEPVKNFFTLFWYPSLSLFVKFRVTREVSTPILDRHDYVHCSQKEPEPEPEKEEPKKEGEEGEEEEAPPEEEPEEPPPNEFEAQNVLMDSVFFDACGCGIGRLDTYLVILALKQLGDDPKFGVETVRFFGKFLGINK
jgi:hypothetical protein